MIAASGCSCQCPSWRGNVQSTLHPRQIRSHLERLGTWKNGFFMTPREPVELQHTVCWQRVENAGVGFAGSKGPIGSRWGLLNLLNLWTLGPCGEMACRGRRRRMRKGPFLTLSLVSPCGSRAEVGVTFSADGARFSGDLPHRRAISANMPHIRPVSSEKSHRWRMSSNTARQWRLSAR